MQKNNNKSPNILVGSMLFGLFFGAGNLIFPIKIGQLSGSNSIYATIGFLITATGIPFLGVLAIGLTDSKNIMELSSRVSKWYSYFFTIALYLTIGPFFALPRTATVSFEVGLMPMLKENQVSLALFIFTAVFFIAALAFSLKPAKILDWIGKFLNPVFLLFLAFLILKAIISPMGDPSVLGAAGNYIQSPLVSGFVDGYGTMDALAALAFGGIVVETIKSFGVSSPKEIAKSTFKSGFVSLLLMCIIYSCLIWLGASSTNILPVAENGGIALAQISRHYLGPFGSIFLAITITIACLKTAIGLVTSCSKIFLELFPNKLSYNIYAVIFSGFSFLVSNLGLNRIIAISLPVLMFLYPLAISLIFLGLFENFFGKSKIVYIATSIGAVFISFADFIKSLPEFISGSTIVESIIDLYSNYIPFFDIGLGWIIPSITGFVIGIIIDKILKSKIIEV